MGREARLTAAGVDKASIQPNTVDRRELSNVSKVRMDVAQLRFLARRIQTPQQFEAILAKCSNSVLRAEIRKLMEPFLPFAMPVDGPTTETVPPRLFAVGDPEQVGAFEDARERVLVIDPEAK